MRQPYDWVLLRVVPRVDRGEFVNAGAIVYCQQLDFLQCASDLDGTRLLALDADVDLTGVRAHLAAVSSHCDAPERPNGELFRWLVAPRSSVVQTSPVHTGLTDDPARELQRLMITLVRR